MTYEILAVIPQGRSLVVWGKAGQQNNPEARVMDPKASNWAVWVTRRSQRLDSVGQLMAVAWAVVIGLSGRSVRSLERAGGAPFRYGAQDGGKPLRGMAPKTSLQV